MRHTGIPFALVLVLAASACTSAAERAASERGRAGALKEESEGEPCLLFIGMPTVTYSPLDPETGLPTYSCGCVYSEESVAYTKAHNEATLAALREGRLAGMTFADRVLTAEGVAARFAAEGGVALVEGGPPAEAPGGRFRVEVAPRNNQGNMSPYLLVTDTSTGKRREVHFLREMKARVLFDHGGRTVLVRDDGFGWTRTFDLARGVSLQCFCDAPEGR